MFFGACYRKRFEKMHVRGHNEQFYTKIWRAVRVRACLPVPVFVITLFKFVNP